MSHTMIQSADLVTDDVTTSDDSSDMTSSLAKSLESASRYKTELCRPFVELDKCRYGDKCQFAHGEGDLRAMDRHPKHKTELCRSFHSTGICPYGSRCHFIHNEQQPPPQSKAPQSDLMSGLAGILAASVPPRAPVLLQGPCSMISMGLGVSGPFPAGLHPGNLLTPSHTEAVLPLSPAPLTVMRPVLPTPPCPILPLDVELGCIAQRRRQLRGSVDSPSEWSMSGSSLSSGSSSSSPITSYLEEAFSPPPTSSVFSPLIGQYVGHSDLNPMGADSMLASAAMLQNAAQSMIAQQQMIADINRLSALESLVAQNIKSSDALCSNLVNLNGLMERCGMTPAGFGQGLPPGVGVAQNSLLAEQFNALNMI